ncbi:Serine/threonine-protein kinase SRPK [Psilocybe cubensis]|uniref:Serine/threonine-protein kinase SRPK n=2 Tax=Psilocybe cubensis TaxID=181762 RepID=A0ACB8GXU7_PSICU|nr:Serine/threonine-protein kinase SRPK [Psilocybe cubensis]KAH9480257.1 Serine/threonine-protein kinase SRPK [Psilocybe cubensis]
MSNFPEEQLDSPAGYFPGKPGLTLDNGRWTIVRKLGWGPRSSTWLAVDNKEHVGEYSAIKILTAEATEESTATNESKLLSGPIKNFTEGFPKLTKTFYQHDDKGKRHYCLAFHVLGSSVEDLRLTNEYDGQYLPVHVVQKIIGDIAERLACLNDEKIIHGAVHPDNFLFFCVQRGESIRKVLAKSPSEKAEEVVGDDGISYPVVRSQPIDHGNPWDSSAQDILNVLIYLANYGHAHHKGVAAPTDARKTYYAPEILKGEKADQKADIWALGCSIYLLLTGTELFSETYVASPVETATETLGKLETLLKESEKLSEKDIAPAASLLRSCLAVKPTKRASAVDVLGSGWIKGGCGCGYCG